MSDNGNSQQSYAKHDGDGTASNEQFAQRSSLYQEFLAEREEILRHKWIESEKQGRDIGFERALLDWIRKHRENWRNSRRQSQQQRG